MSIWDKAQGINYKDFLRWPNPFPCGIRHFEQTVCGSKVLLDIETIGNCIGNYWWSEFIPSPVEVTRKQITGQGACGFKYKVKKGKPISILWGDTPSINRRNLLGEFTSPLFFGAYVVWMTGAISEGLSLYTSFFYHNDAARLEGPSLLVPSSIEAQLANNTSQSYPTTSPLCSFVLELFPPQSLAQAPFPGYWRTKLYGTVFGGSTGVKGFRSYFTSGDEQYGDMLPIDVAPGQPKSFKVTYEGPGVTNTLGAEVNNDEAPQTFPLARYQFTRWIVEWSPDPWPPRECSCVGLMDLSLTQD